MKHHGSGDYVNMLKTDGLIVHPDDELILPKDTVVKFYPWQINPTLLSTPTHQLSNNNTARDTRFFMETFAIPSY